MALLEMGEFNDIQKRDSWMLRAENASLMRFGFAKLQTPPKRIGIQFLSLDILIHLNGKDQKC